MRKLITLVAILGLTANAFAVVKTPGHKKPSGGGGSEGGRHQTQESRVGIGWYVAPVLKVGEIKDDFKAMVGVRGGLEFNNSFYVGLAGYGLPDTRYHQHMGYPYNDYYDHGNGWDFGYGGLEFGVITGKPRSGQISFGMLIGGGSVNEHLPYYDYYDYHHDKSFFVLEPQIDLSQNLSRYVRVSLGAGYRFVNDLHSQRYTQHDLEGATINFAIGFGRF